MFLPLSRIALSLGLAATATLGVVAQTPDNPAADAQQAAEIAPEVAVPATPEPPAGVTPPVDSVSEPVAESVPEVPAEPEPIAEVTEPAEVAEPVEVSVVVTPVEPAVVIEPTPSVVVEAAPAPAGPVCCPLNVVDYRTTLSAKRAYRCYGPGVNTSVCVDNPADCTCTHYEVQLCVPACCTGVPRQCKSTGLFGRGKVDLVWDCGFTATVVFRVHGGAIVIYQG